jgi:hypothetical protein
MDIYNINVILASGFYPVTLSPGLKGSQAFAVRIALLQSRSSGIKKLCGEFLFQKIRASARIFAEV